jgi:hypothetical protein
LYYYYREVSCVHVERVYVGIPCARRCTGNR